MTPVPVARPVPPANEERLRSEQWPIDDAVRMVCDGFVRTVNDNNRAYLEHRPCISIDIDEAADAFGEFAGRIDATGDIDAAVHELGRVHNAG